MGNPGSPCYRCDGPATLLCDGRRDDGKTCSTPMCNRHAHNVGHYHARRSARDGGSFRDTIDYCDACWAKRKEERHASMG